jgi:hypothetical protein
MQHINESKDLSLSVPQVQPTPTISPPPVQGDSTFWTIIAIAILLKVIMSYPIKTHR